jgi:hypothetical protein
LGQEKYLQSFGGENRRAEQLGRSGQVWYHNVKWIFKGVGWEVVE